MITCPNCGRDFFDTDYLEHCRACTPRTTGGPVAYDYDRQQWTTGPAAVKLRREQITMRLRSLESTDGENFAKWCGIKDREQAIANLRGELAQLEAHDTITP